jgi:hypothetical protein
LGFTPLDRLLADVLYRMIASRHERSCLIVTSNKSIESWGEVFPDPVIASVMLHRLEDRWDEKAGLHAGSRWGAPVRPRVEAGLLVPSILTKDGACTLALMDSASFAALVTSKLSRLDAGETLHIGAGWPLAPFDQYLARSREEVEQKRLGRLRSISAPPSSHLLKIQSWQHGFTSSGTPAHVERAARDALFLKVQAWGHEWVSARRWKQCLHAFDFPDRWIALAREIQEDGRIVESNAALAAACWLDPASSRAGAAALIAARPLDLPDRLREQPDPTFRSKAFHERHWSAWDMKNYALLDLPSLLAFESDENFSVRTRVYRSLGQSPHPAAIQALQEGMLDPHPFARGQAVRSLGWCADPTSIGWLAYVSEQDPNEHVRRAADQARQRIIGYWTYFGEWAVRTDSVASCIQTARELLEQGLPRIALDVLRFREETDEALWEKPDNVLDELLEELSGIDPDALLDAPERHYTHWFGEARRVEAALREGPWNLERCREALDGTDEAERSLALLQVSAQRHEELLPTIEALSGAPEPIGWCARRALRCMGRGTMPQRRAAFYQGAWRQHHGSGLR